MSDDECPHGLASRCRKCGEQIEVGDSISLERNDDDERWVCCP